MVHLFLHKKLWPWGLNHNSEEKKPNSINLHQKRSLLSINKDCCSLDQTHCQPFKHEGKESGPDCTLLFVSQPIHLSGLSALPNRSRDTLAVKSSSGWWGTSWEAEEEQGRGWRGWCEWCLSFLLQRWTVHPLYQKQSFLIFWWGSFIWLVSQLRLD